MTSPLAAKSIGYTSESPEHLRTLAALRRAHAVQVQGDGECVRRRMSPAVDDETTFPLPPPPAPHPMTFTTAHNTSITVQPPSPVSLTGTNTPHRTGPVPTSFGSEPSEGISSPVVMQGGQSGGFIPKTFPEGSGTPEGFSPQRQRYDSRIPDNEFSLILRAPESTDSGRRNRQEHGETGYDEGVSPRRHRHGAAVARLTEVADTASFPHLQEPSTACNPNVGHPSPRDELSAIRTLQTQVSQIMEVVCRIDAHQGGAYIDVLELQRALYMAETERDNLKSFLRTKEEAIIILTRQLQTANSELSMAKETIGALQAKLRNLEGDGATDRGTSGGTSRAVSLLPAVDLPHRHAL